MAEVHTFYVIVDSGHAWLMTTKTRLAEAGLTEADISNYSYQHPSHETIALEEDLDLGVFVNAYKERTGKDVRFKESHCDRSRVRNWPSFGTRKFD